MTDTTDIIQKLQAIRDEMIADATKEANRWYEAAIAPLNKMSLLSDSIRKHAKESQISIDPDGSLINQVRSAIARFEGKAFSTKEISDIIEPFYPLNNPTRKATFSNTLRKLWKDYKEIDREKAGRGSSPSIYRAKKGGRDAAAIRTRCPVAE
jgi:hypothetical protein